jgi:beta-xylosidase
MDIMANAWRFTNDTSVGPGTAPGLDLLATKNMIERFPDPAVLRVGSTYYAYATRQGPMNIQVSTSNDLIYWSEPRNALPEIPDWSQARTWAPTVIQRGSTFVMWYATRDKASQRQCLSVATATNPLGPFVDRSTRSVICQLDRGGSIDPEAFTDSTGRSYLVWKSEDNALLRPTALWSSPLSRDGTSIEGATKLLDASGGWENYLIEGPAMVEANGQFLLFYGANAWQSTSAGVGYATCKTPSGPCVDTSKDRPWMSTSGSMLGPSGPAFFTDADGKQRITFHAWDGCVGGPPCNRAAFFRTFSLNGDVPVMSR